MHKRNPSDITYDTEVLLGPWHNAAEQPKQMQEQDATEHLQVPAACHLPQFRCPTLDLDSVLLEIQ